MQDRNAPAASPDGVARRPEDLDRLLVDRGNAGDVEGVVELYEPDAVVVYPPGRITRGHAAIRAMWADILARGTRLVMGPPMPTIVNDEIALTVTPPEEDASTRAQVVRRQPDGRWLRVIDQPPYGAVGVRPAQESPESREERR